jgi:hypothetical protein
MTITAKRFGRIDVWPRYRDARLADTDESKYVGRCVVWPTIAQAIDAPDDSGGNVLRLGENLQLTDRIWCCAGWPEENGPG